MIPALLILSFFINILLFILYRKQLHYSRQLFKRSWDLERTLIHIYKGSSQKIKQIIEGVLTNIQPL